MTYRLMAQDHMLKFSHITIEHGLSQNSINWLFQDRRGYLWIGTEDGLNRFDGYQFKVFEHVPSLRDSLSHNFIYGIVEDSDNQLWIGTWGGGLNRFDPRTETFQSFRHDPNNINSLSDDKIYSLIIDQSNILWIGTESGLNRMDPETHMIKRFFPAYPEKEKKKKLDITVLTIHETDDRYLWIGTQGDGLFRFDKKGFYFTRFRHREKDAMSLPNDYVWSIYEDHRKKLWIGTRAGIAIFNRQLKRFERIDNGIFFPDTMLKSSIYTILEDQQKRLWIGTWGQGLFRYKPELNEFRQYRQTSSETTGLNSNYISFILEDRSGLIWIGTYGGGINKMNPKTDVFKHYTHIPAEGNSINDRTILSLLEDRNGSLWVGTRNGGLNHFNPFTKRWEFYKRRAGRSNEITDNAVWSIYEDSRGKLWIGTRKGLDILDRETGKFSHVPLKTKTQFITSIVEDREGLMWIGSYGKGIFKLKERVVVDRYIPDKKNPNAISNLRGNVLLLDRSGIIWVGTYGGGLNRYNRQRNGFDHFRQKNRDDQSLSHDVILSLYQDRNGTLWIGTLGGGLNRFNPESETFRRFGKIDGLPNMVVNGIVEEATVGTEAVVLWLSTYRGLSRFDTRQTVFKNFYKSDGLQSNEFNKGAACSGKQGVIYFGGLNGFNKIHPDQITVNSYSPATVITGFQVMNRDRFKPVIADPDHTIQLTYRDYVFSFEFAGLDFSAPENNRYRYKLDGFNERWFETDAKKRYATYTNLDPGDYIFMVKASNSDGVWHDNIGHVKIRINPPVWGTWWFKTLAVLFFAVFSYWIIHLSRKYIILTDFWKRKKYISNFKLLDKIGSGGMGTIYKANHLIDKKNTVAIKILNNELFNDDISRKRFKQEAVIIDQLDHPNIVKVIERGISGDNLYMAMELLEGITLAEKIEKENVISFRDIQKIGIQILDAIEKVHGRNIIHRDLKPENVMLCVQDGNNEFVKLLDFGLATMQYQTRLTQTGVVIGTINYMSPEQITESRTSKASDIYSIGVMFYEMACGRKPFTGDTVVALMKQIIDISPIEPDRFRKDIPEAFNRLIIQMLSKDADSRPGIEEIIHVIQSVE